MSETCDECGRDAPADPDTTWFEVNARHCEEDDEETVFCSTNCMKEYWF